MLPSRSCATPSRNSGFSLIELAITLVIVGVLASSVLVPLVSQMAARNVAVTDKTLTEIKDALIGFAAATGRLPCPASLTSNGLESFTTVAPAGNTTNGRCETYYGFVPAVTLGINPVDNFGFAVDGWGSSQNRIRYAVYGQTINGQTNPFTSANGMRNATLNAIAADAQNLLYVCASGIGVVAGTNCGAALTLTSKAPVVVWSVGANAATGGTNTDEMENPNPNCPNPNSPNPICRNPNQGADIIFVSHSISASTTNPFDDLVTWIGVPTLVNKMIASGQLP